MSHPLLSAPIGSSLWRLAGPTTAVMLAQTLVAIAETFIFGRLGTDALAGFAIDADPATAWRSQHYLGNPVFGGLKAGSGLILDLGRRVRLRSVRVIFGAEPGADVAIELGDSDTPAASTLGTFTAVAAADGVGGTRTFRTSSPAR